MDQDLSPTRWTCAGLHLEAIHCYLHCCSPSWRYAKRSNVKRTGASFYTQICASAPIDGFCYKRRGPYIFLVSLLESCRDIENQENFSRHENIPMKCIILDAKKYPSFLLWICFDGKFYRIPI